MIEKFRIEQRVIVGDEYPGTITGIRTGKGETLYEVKLDNGEDIAAKTSDMSRWNPSFKETSKTYETVVEEPEEEVVDDVTSETEEDDESEVTE